MMSGQAAFLMILIRSFKEDVTDRKFEESQIEIKKGVVFDALDPKSIKRRPTNRYFLK